jgi:competence protein ComGC
MNINTAYKGLVYLALWVIVYFAIRYILSKKEFEEIDMILIASIITILVIVIDITINKLSTQNDKMHCTGETFNNIVNNTDATQSNYEPDIISTAISVKPVPEKQQEKIKSGTNLNNRFYARHDSMGNKVVFDTNAFGGTIKRPDNNIIKRPGNNNDSTNSQYICQKRTNNLKWYEQVIKPRDFAGAENLDQIATTTGTRDNLLVNQMIYSDFNRLPPSLVKDDYEYGYSFMPPKDWYPTPLYPPVCVTNNPRTTMPVYLDTTTMDLKDWHETTKITPPDKINTSFITAELNSK